MKRRMRKRVLSLFMIAVLILSTGIMPSYAEAPNETEFEEPHVDITITDLELCVHNKKNLSVDIDKSKSFFKRQQAKKEAEKLKECFEKCPEFEQLFIDSINDDTPVQAIGYTEVPIQEVNGNWERVEKPDNTSGVLSASAYSTSNYASNLNDDMASHGYLYLGTLIMKHEKISGNKYEYEAITTAQWKKNSAISGENYPAGGNDYIYQTAPKTFDVIDDNCNLEYNRFCKASPSRLDIADNCAAFFFKDDPTGPAQLKKVKIDAYYEAPASTKMRKIISYYVHSYNTVSFSASASIQIGTETSTSLSITPSSISKSWQVCNYVNFKF